MTYDNQPEEISFRGEMPKSFDFIRFGQEDSKNVTVKSATFASIVEHVDHAREKHPWPKTMTDADKFNKVENEMNEMAKAMLKKDRRGTKKEALDAIAVLVRIVEEE